jgi:hypothetical protein
MSTELKVGLVLVVLNAVTRALPDSVWEKLPEWLRVIAKVFQDLGPDTVKALERVAPK